MMYAIAIAMHNAVVRNPNAKLTSGEMHSLALIAPVAGVNRPLGQRMHEVELVAG
jgi:hypothetical protein